MKTVVFLLSILCLSATVHASTDEFDANQFALNYYNAWTAAQSPQATKSDIQNYLALLKDDVGHQHLPYDPDATRSTKGKHKMLEGMLYYLNAHAEYKSKLKNVVIGFNVVVIEYSTYSKGKHPQTGEWIEQTYNTVEVLELEDGKVAVIRKYSE
jgi:ketosteroid isomerase-like protein